MTTTKHTSFQEIEFALKQCELATALQLGKQTLNDAKIAEDDESLAKTYAIMATVWQKKGQYSGNKAHTSNALKSIDKAIQLIPKINSLSVQADIYNVASRIYLSRQDLRMGHQLVEDGLRISNEINYEEGKYNSYMNLVGLYALQNNFSTALDYAFECYHFANEKGDKILLARALQSISSLYATTLQYEDIFKYAKQSLRLAQISGDKESEIVALINLSAAYGSTGDYKNCMIHLMDSLKKSEAIKYRSNIAKCHGNIGTLYTYLSNNDEALKHYEIVYNEYIDVIDKRDEVALLVNLGDLYFARKEFDFADTYYTLCLEQAIRINFNEIIAIALGNKSKLANKRGNTKEALQYASEAQKYHEKLNFESNNYHSHLLNLAEISLGKREYHQVIKYGEEGQKLCILRKDNYHLSHIFDVLSKGYEGLKDFEMALAFRNKYIELKQELNNEQKYHYIIDMQIAYETEKKEKEIAQLTKENQLQALLLEKSKQIEVKNELLERANQELQQFTYAASHDLKEPLRMIGSYTTLLERRLRGKLDDSTIEFMHYISSGVLRMNKLLEDLLKYATLLNNDHQQEWVDLNNVVQDVLDNFQLKIQETEAVIKVDKLPTIKGYRSQLLQLFQNLISNAIKFKKSDLVPTITISNQEDPQQHIIVVKDEGIGIPPDSQKKVFDIFYRLHRKQDYEGTGIGLALCQKIALKHGGIIWMKSEEGKGTSFFISLPKS